MRKILFLLVMMLSATPLALALELARFDSNNYNTWSYTRPGFVMSTEVINQDKVTLYKATNADYTLISPSITKGQFACIEVDITGYAKQFTSSYYNAFFGSPTIEIISEAGDVLKSVFCEFEDACLEHKFSVSIRVSDLDVPSFKVRVACWQARIYDAFSVREVVVGMLSGDVNNDGSVTSTDVTVLYDYLLNSDSSNMVYGDQDGDGVITSSDVTLVYSIMLGN